MTVRVTFQLFQLRRSNNREYDSAGNCSNFTTYRVLHINRLYGFLTFSCNTLTSVSGVGKKSIAVYLRYHSHKEMSIAWDFYWCPYSAHDSIRFSIWRWRLFCHSGLKTNAASVTRRNEYAVLIAPSYIFYYYNTLQMPVATTLVGVLPTVSNNSIR